MLVLKATGPANVEFRCACLVVLSTEAKPSLTNGESGYTHRSTHLGVEDSGGRIGGSSHLPVCHIIASSTHVTIVGLNL